MKKFSKSALVRAFGIAGLCMFACAVRAEGDAETLITTAQTTITTLVTAVIAAGATILLALLSIKALPFAYRKISAFFK
jgi:hypothetical protein